MIRHDYEDNEMKLQLVGKISQKAVEKQRLCHYKLGIYLWNEISQLSFGIEN